MPQHVQGIQAGPPKGCCGVPESRPRPCNMRLQFNGTPPPQVLHAYGFVDSRRHLLQNMLALLNVSISPVGISVSENRSLSLRPSVSLPPFFSLLLLC